MNEKIQRMLNVICENDKKLINKENYRSYLAPEIPDKVVEKMTKIYDHNLSVKDILAFYDISLFHTYQNGFIFMTEGIYHHYIGKAVYIRYSDISNIHVSGDELRFSLSGGDMEDYTVFCCEMNLDVFKRVVDQLRNITADYTSTSCKPSGKVKKLDLPTDMMKECNVIIHSASVAAGGIGTGLAQIPASDNVLIVPIQVTMITSLGKKVFDLDITESAAKSIIASVGASIAGRTAVQFLWGWIPAIGNLINTATAASITEAIGWIAVADFYHRWLEDRNKGRYTGMKDGYNAASEEYEDKLRKQAEEFLKQKTIFQQQMDEYEILLKACEAYIDELHKHADDSNHLHEMEDLYQQLKNLRNDGKE